MEYPTGTVTFLFTDIEGSTKLAQEHPDKWESLQARHHAILQSTIEEHNGFVFQIIGDAFCAAFHTAKDGFNAAIESQRKLQIENWDETPVKVRMGLHTGSAELRGNDYHGYLSLVIVQRVMSVAYGGQVLISNASAELIHNELPQGIALRDMKEHRLKGLLNPERLWQIVALNWQQDFPPLQSLNETPNNLPVRLSRFIGRGKEVHQVKERLEKYRLVTLVGSGGIGKTRLSIQVSSELLPAYSDGVWLIELAPLTDPALVARTVCTALDLTQQGNIPPLEALISYLHTRKILLVLDNCEHLIEACAQLAEALLLACPNLGMIASSREALGIDGEHAYRVPSLSLPEARGGLKVIAQSEAAQLFVERASALMPDFQLTERNAPVVAQICQRLDGIALAIELASARVKTLKVEQIAARLDDVFRLLTGGSRTALPRQQTLRALIDWSYNLLTEEECAVLRHLSVFMGGWTLEAAEFVCDNADLLDLLTHLVDKSLVAVDFEQGDEPRYFLLETIRQFAREKLAENGEGQQIRAQHLEYYLKLVETLEPGLRGPNQVALLDQLEREFDNLRIALEWSLESAPETGQHLASMLKWFWHLRNHWAEGIIWLKRSLVPSADFQTNPSNEARLRRVKALQVLTYLCGTLGEMETGIASVTESMALCEKNPGMDSERLMADNYQLSSTFALLNGDVNQANLFAEKSLGLYQNLGDKFGIAEVQSDNLYWLALRAGDFATAQVLFESALSIRKELGDKDGIAYALMLGAAIAFCRSDYAYARDLLNGAMEACRETRAWHLFGLSLGNLGLGYLFDGDELRARKLISQAFQFAREKANPILQAACIYWTALLVFNHEQYHQFIQLFSAIAGTKYYYSVIYFVPPIVQSTFQQYILTAHEKLDQQALESAEAEGKAMTFEQVLNLVEEILQ